MKSGSRTRKLRALSAPSGLAGAVRACRREAGLSQRELAEACEVSNSTIAAIERGGDAHWLTLAALMDVLPGLAARDVLPNPEGHPPPALAAAWHAHRDVFGWECERATVLLRRRPSGACVVTTELGPVRMASGEPLSEGSIAALARILLRGSRREAGRLDAAPLVREGRLDVTTSAARHEFRLAEDRSSLRCLVEEGAGLPVTVVAGADALETASFTLDHPVRDLRLAIEAPLSADMRPRAVAWLVHGMSEPWESSLLRFLHPRRHPQLRREGRTQRAELRVDWPPVGVTYSLYDASVLPEAQRPRRIGRRVHAPADDIAEVGRRLAALRRDHGLTLLEVEPVLGISRSTIHALEEGIGGRASVLARYVEAFPELAPQDLLPLPSPQSRLGHGDLRRFHARVFGFEAEVVRRVLELRDDGMVRTTRSTEGLKAIGRRSEPVRIRTRVRNVMTTMARARPDVTSRDDVKRRSYVEGGEVVTEYIVPRNVAERGTSYRTQGPWRSQFHFDPTPLLVEGAEPPVIEGTSETLPHPTRRLELQVHFPSVFVPRSWGFAAWPDPFPPEPTEGARLDVLHHFEHEAGMDPRTRVAALVVHDPLPGFRYACWWEVALPDR